MSEQEATPAPDDVAQAGRVRLADWLTAEAGNPELATSVEELAGWPAYQAEEFLVFVPPGFANRIFLLTDRGITSFAPSEQSLPQAMEAARQ
ncbi:hypothetical protein E1263_18700 [Kribbella antibiotica]|uniref:Uncharacterized protein n=1 Tax=Kribbella antibiotica TaxID=190195 RepID=A0A4R4ZJ93_9ACTN|nr:hypothetical protein [Kribbella antibiotica]TDD58545.1 hypothetical protein E1263_18700 [Kribbella antibiotica]